MRKGISNFLVDTYYDCNCTRHVWTWLYNADHLVPSPFASCSFQVLPQFPAPFLHGVGSALLSSSGRGQVSNHILLLHLLLSLWTLAPWIGDDSFLPFVLHSHLSPPRVPRLSAWPGGRRRIFQGINRSWCSVTPQRTLPLKPVRSTPRPPCLLAACWDRWTGSLSSSQSLVPFSLILPNSDV